jgi:hypothetical protein
MVARRTTRNQSDVTRDINGIIDAFKVIEREMVRGALSGMQIASEKVYSDAVNTTAYDDDTTATRESTAVYVSNGQQWPHGMVAISRSLANAFRPGSGASDNAPPQPPRDWLVLDLITSTDYSYLLNIRFGGRSMFIANAILGNGGLMMSLVENAVRAAFANIKPAQP